MTPRSSAGNDFTETSPAGAAARPREAMAGDALSGSPDAGRADVTHPWPLGDRSNGSAPGPVDGLADGGEDGRRDRPRIRGVDVARAVAIIGMFAVHVGPTGGEGVAERLYALPHGRASLLFVLVAGVGVSLLASAPTASGARTAGKLLWRAALLLPLGLVLQELDHRVSVILQDYALLFVLAVVLVRVPDRWLLRLAVVSVPLGSIVFLSGQMRAPEVYARQPVVLADTPAEAVHGLVLSGPYPLVTWFAPFVIGMWLGRRDLRSSVVRRRLVVAGAAVAVLASATSTAVLAALGGPSTAVGWDHLAYDAAHSQMPLWIIGSTAAAAAVLGAALVAADSFPKLTRPLMLTGQVALTVYVGHLLALHALPDDATGSSVGSAIGVLVLFALSSAVFAHAWMRWFRQGPLEAAISLPWRAGDRRRSRTRAPGTVRRIGAPGG